MPRPLWTVPTTIGHKRECPTELRWTLALEIQNLGASASDEGDCT